MKKNKLPDWFPTVAHENWYKSGCPAFSKEILDETKVKLTKLGVQNFLPKPKEIFMDFAINPDDIRLVIVNSVYPLCVRRNEDGSFPPYSEYPQILKEIWDILQNEYGWTDGAEKYTYPDLSDWKHTLLLNTCLTSKGNTIWEPFMKELFSWFGESLDYYVFVFLDEPCFNTWSKYVKNKDIFYKFKPKEIAQVLDKQFGGIWHWGLPF